jgi:hypothetical protein
MATLELEIEIASSLKLVIGRLIEAVVGSRSVRRVGLFGARIL